MPRPIPAMDAAALEAVVLGRTPWEAWFVADSLVAARIITPSAAAGLRARAANTAGFFDVFASSLDSLFAAAIGEVPGGDAGSEDSVWHFSVLLNGAYYHARARAYSTGGHAEAEERLLRTILAHAPIGWQRLRAHMELGRMYRFRSGVYAASADCTETARRHLASAAWASQSDDSRAAALWQLAWLEAEAGDWDRAGTAANEMREEFRGTKWEERSALVAGMQGRRELGVARVAAQDGSLVVAGTARNLQGPLTVSLARFDAAWMQRQARVPTSEERLRSTAWCAAATNLAVGAVGRAWEVALPVVPPGFYRLRISVADTFVAYTVGVLDVDLEGEEAGGACLVNRSPSAVMVYGVSVADGAHRPDSRIVEPGAAWCLGRDTPSSFVVCDGEHAGWWGPRHAGPTWIIRPGAGGRSGSG